MLFSGWAFFMAAIRALALASPTVPARVACHSASVGLEDMRLPSSLTEPISIGTFLEISGAGSKKERTVTTLPSTVGPIPTRGVDPAGEPIPRVRGIGPLILAAAALAAAFSFAHSILCSEARSFGANPRSLMICLDNSLDCSAPGGLPPPPDCTDARWKSPAAEGMPIRQVTLEPPPDWP